jgi:hypothetical protein
MKNKPARKNCGILGSFDKIIAVFLFGMAFGLVEAMVVIYLRQILASTNHDFFIDAIRWSKEGAKVQLISLGFIFFLKPEVLVWWDTLHLEILRESATILMLLSIGYVTGKSWKSRFAYFLMAFGVWDIFYYIWLFWLNGWPRSLMDIDVLFLIPVPWISPVYVPVLISLLMISVSLWIINREV